MTAAPRSILIVLTGALGDIARGLSIIDPLRQRFPGSAIDWVAEERWAPIVRLHPEVRNVLTWQRRRWFSSTWALRRLVRGKYDIVLDLQRIFKSGVFSYLTAAPRRIGFHRKNAKEGNWLFSNEWLPPRSDSTPKIEQYFDAVRLLGCEIPERPTFGLERAVLPEVSQLPERYITLVLGSAWPSKDWTEEGYARLTALLLQNGESVVLVGGRETSPIANRLTKTSKVLSLVGRTNLVELLSVLRGSRCVVGPDSGPGHLSSAVGVPYVSLFGPTAPARTAPFGMHHLVVQGAPLRCQPCYERRCPGYGHMCMRLIRPDAVYHTVERVLSGLEKPFARVAPSVVV